jgi:hypothetical protein
MGAFSGTIIVDLNRGDSLSILQQTKGITIFSSFDFEIIEVPFGIDGSTLRLRGGYAINESIGFY